MLKCGRVTLETVKPHTKMGIYIDLSQQKTLTQQSDSIYRF